MGRRLTYEEVKNFIEIESDSGCKLMSKERLPREKLVIKCKCGEIFTTTYSNFKRQQRQCVKCGLLNKKTKLRKTNEQFLNEVFALYRDEYTVIDTYQTSTIKVSIKHNTCNNIFDVRPCDFLNQKSKCPICSNRAVIKGVNDIATTHPDIAKLIIDKNLAETISSGSKKKVLVSCPICSNVKKMYVYALVKEGKVTCNICGDGFSIPEKIMASILSQVGVGYEWDKAFPWSQDKRYDFYIPYLNCIVETHGLQHYEEVPSWGKSLVEIQSNDKFKMQLAKENNIERYIVIDCRESDIDFIKFNVLKSELKNLINISLVDWHICAIDSFGSLVEKSIDLYNKGFSVREIADELRVTTPTIVGYLKKGSSLNLCEYSKEKSKLDGIKRKNKKVICLNTEQVFNSVKSASSFYNVQISNCLGGRQKTAGVHPVTGEGLRWMYYDAYISKIGGDYHK